MRRCPTSAQAACASALILTSVLGVMFPGSAPAAELFAGANEPLGIPDGVVAKPATESAGAVAELPSPRAVPAGIEAELARLQKQIDELRAANGASPVSELLPPPAAEKKKPAGPAGEKSEKSGE